MRRCTMRAHLRLMTLSLMVMHACRRASRRPLNAARSCARRGPARNVLFCLQTLKNGTLTHPSLWQDYCFHKGGEVVDVGPGVLGRLGGHRGILLRDTAQLQIGEMVIERGKLLGWRLRVVGLSHGGGPPLYRVLVVGRGRDKCSDPGGRG